MSIEKKFKTKSGKLASLALALSSLVGGCSTLSTLGKKDCYNCNYQSRGQGQETYDERIGSLGLMPKRGEYTSEEKEWLADLDKKDLRQQLVDDFGEEYVQELSGYVNFDDLSDSEAVFVYRNLMPIYNHNLINSLNSN